jgi:hypothetical protein
VNYDESELIKYAELFYNENDKPYNKDAILQAEYVTEYWKGGKRVTLETYNKEADRYETLPDFLLWLQ